MKLIDKAALVAEIEKRRNDYINSLMTEQVHTLSDILDFINTLEVKEVDLEKYYHDFLQREWFDKNCNRTVSEMMAFTAKHFFELGLSFSNSTKVTTPDIEDVLKENGVNPYSKEAKIIKESYFMALEKLKAQKGEEV